MQGAKVPDTIVIATGNQHKLAEFRQMFGASLNVKSQRDLLSQDPQINESALSFHGNALIKALAIHEATNLPTLADDSGLCVRGLNMAPGIYSARYAGSMASDQENRQKLLGSCQDLNGPDLDAWFCCALCYIDERGVARIFTGQVKGRIQLSESGEHGFGYDPIFYLPDHRQTMAELPEAEKNKISHRAIAARKLTSYLFS